MDGEDLRSSRLPAEPTRRRVGSFYRASPHLEIVVERETNIMQILDKLDRGLIEVEEAERLLESQADTHDFSQSVSEEVHEKPKIDEGWLILFSFGLAATVTGAWTASLGGWWWLFAGPALLAGVLLVTLAAWSRSAPWIHIRWKSRRDPWPRRLEVHLPIPVGVAAWAVRAFGRHSDALCSTGVDELLEALEGQLSRETPLYVQVDEGENGEHIEVRFG